ncbi:glycerophosphodiester phosphodiesterase family protein [Lihuaxuella thermophila]|uniref:Glycerophosphoryl diester phosphodiesterase n=1 Tax=Lihuaxuella thermophila TaxID=1173111 RepID=A0A1H8CBU0_9BACL|nr:glycerophosphodiester phosphodiesterase family protein [Lihuaxuella thermophila]SEM92480.1 glycerophosphoryl diester phosphodiesterase [Lihuaxuella thermophila]
MKLFKNKPFKRKWIYVSLLFLLFVYLNNSSLLVAENQGKPLLLAHRGLAQTFPMEGLTNETCTAKRIYQPEHPYLENTIPSMKAAFQAGADVVELDVHPTKDGKWAVFHDWTLECRTNGKGVTRDHTLAELKKLDIGYGYTADGGKTFPFRGKGVGLMPSLDEVFRQFPNQSFLIHIKSDDPKEGIQLAGYLSKLPPSHLDKLAVYGGDQPIQALQERLPGMRVMSKQTMKDCLVPYIAVGWTGYVPSSCSRTQLHIPEKIAPWLWGWPDRFLQRMDQHDTRVILVAGGGGFSEGFDTAEDLKRLPRHYTGGIWTNRIDRVAPLLKEEIQKQE